MHAPIYLARTVRRASRSSRRTYVTVGIAGDYRRGVKAGITEAATAKMSG